MLRSLPNLFYNIKSSPTDPQVLVGKNLWRRAELLREYKTSMTIFDEYIIKEGERPEDIAFKYYGDAELHWVVLMMNDVTDRFYQWPMTQPQFDEFLTDKYGAGNEDSAHHYELTKSSGNTNVSGPNDYSHRVEVNSDETDAITITNREYEERLQDKYRTIRLLDRRYLDDFIEEFDNLIKQQ